MSEKLVVWSLRELDALVATSIPSLDCRKLPVPEVVGVPGHIRELGWKNGSLLEEGPPYFSSDIGAAWEAVEKVTKSTAYRRFDLLWDGDDGVALVHFFQPGREDAGPEASFATAPTAIALCALRAVGVEVEMRLGEGA